MEVFTEFNSLPVVDAQESYGGAADRSLASQGCSGPLKVVGPLIATRVKQRYELVGMRIQGGDVWTLMAIAVAACKRQIIGLADATVLLSNDML
jgi:hypothetical protein